MKFALWHITHVSHVWAAHFDCKHAVVHLAPVQLMQMRRESNERHAIFSIRSAEQIASHTRGTVLMMLRSSISLGRSLGAAR